MQDPKLCSEKLVKYKINQPFFNSVTSSSYVPIYSYYANLTQFSPIPTIDGKELEKSMEEARKSFEEWEQFHQKVLKMMHK